MQTPLNQLPNPTDEDRHQMLRNALEAAGRPEDYEYILKYLSPPEDIINLAAPGEMKGVKIGIIGGGIAGMCSAFELRKLGADITILEASEHRIGGRVYTYYFDDPDLFGEFGAMRIPVTHETTWYYMNLFRLNTISMTSPKRNNFLYVHNTRLRTTQSIEEYLYPYYNLTPTERNTSWANLSDYALNHRFLQLTPSVRSELIRILPSYSPEFIPLMNLSIRQNFEDLELSQGAISLISGVDPVIGALLGISYDEIAHEEYTFDYRNTYRIEGGNVHLPLAFYSSFMTDSPASYHNLPSGGIGKVHFKQGHQVTGIYESGYRNKIVVKYKNKKDLTPSADIFDYVLCAIPFSTLRNVEIKPSFQNQKMQAILELNYIDAQKTLFLCNKRFWERNTDYGNIIGGISFTDLPIQSIIYPGDHNVCLLNNTCSSEEPGVLVASYNLAQNSVRVGGLKDNQRFELIKNNVEEVHGLPRGFLNSIVESHRTVHWNNEPLYLGALAYTKPEQKRLFSYEMQQPEYHGHVYFAGEHVSAKHGWMQGALYSGKFAANQIAKHYHTFK